MGIKHLKQKQYTFYKSIVSQHCPILNETVYFAGIGFKHLLYKSNGAPRNVNEQYMKLKFLYHATDVIKNCKVISETRIMKRKIKGKEKQVTRYALVHEVKKGLTVRVIVEKVGTGKHQFLSIMPHDRQSRKSVKKQKIKVPKAAP